MENNPVRFGQCCEKCGRPKMSCVCIQNIKVEESDFGKHLKKMMPFLGLEKSYTEEEVIKLCRSYAHDEACNDNWDEDKWIKENLK